MERTHPYKYREGVCQATDPNECQIPDSYRGQPLQNVTYLLVGRPAASSQRKLLPLPLCRKTEDSTIADEPAFDMQTCDMNDIQDLELVRHR